MPKKKNPEPFLKVARELNKFLTEAPLFVSGETSEEVAEKLLRNLRDFIKADRKVARAIKRFRDEMKGVY
jgi:hypothetical protein